MPTSSMLYLKEPVSLSSILESSAADAGSSTSPTLTKIIGTLGPQSRSVEILEKLLQAGMCVARFDFSWGDDAYHQETLENLRTAVKNTKRLCAVMLDTVGPELQVLNNSNNNQAIAIDLQQGETIILTPDKSKPASSNFLPINYADLAFAVKPGDEIFVGQYLFTGSEATSVWLEVMQTQGDDVHCVIKNSAILTGSLFTALASQVRIGLPTLSESDKTTLQNWALRNQIDFVSLSYTRHANDVRLARKHLSKLGELYQTQIFAKIENIEGLEHFDEILKEADGIILSRGNLGIDLPAEKVFVFQKAAIYKCNMAGKPAIITRVLDSMVDSPRPTRAEATDVANAVLDGTDAIMLGAETLRGNYPVETVTTIHKICSEAEKVYNQALYYKRAVAYNNSQPLWHLESVASSVVQAASKVKASVIVVFTSSGRAGRLISKYRPAMPVLTVVISKLTTENKKTSWSFSGAYQARQCLIVRGLFPMLADPQHQADSAASSNESILKVALDYAKAEGIVKEHDCVVLFGRLDSFNNKPHWKLTEELIEETVKVVQGTCILFGT